jgi:tRNA nucleotidyltransferase (CCA-adding enzyme)
VLPARYATLAQELDRKPAAQGQVTFDARSGVARADALARRLRPPLDCRDAARLAVRWHHAMLHAETLAPAALLALLLALDALRRPERIDVVAAAAAAHASAGRKRARSSDARAADSPAVLLHEALGVVRQVDAAAIAREVIARAAESTVEKHDNARGERIAKALRSARLAALREWKSAR